MGEDLVSKLRRVLYQHQVHLEPAAVFYTEQQWSPDSNDPTLAYLSKVLLDDDDRVESVPAKPFQGLLDELTAIVSPSSSSGDSGSPGSPLIDGIISPELETRFETADIHSYLLECARAVAVKNHSRFYALANELKHAVSSQSTPVERLAVFFIEALVARVTGTGPQTYRSLCAGISTRRLLTGSRLSRLPSTKITHIFANDVILHACAGAKRVHIVDYGIHCGQQWPSLIKALSVRAEGPPHLKITGIDETHSAEAAQVGECLTEYARSVGVRLEFCLILSNTWEAVRPVTQYNEFLIVNSNMRLHNMKDEWVAINNPRRLLFDRIYKMRPKLVMLAVLNASMSSPFFMPKFEEALKHYTAKMEYINEWLGKEDLEEMNVMERSLEKWIMSVVACDGLDQVDRPEKYKTWDARAKRAGFVPLPISDEVYERVKMTWGGYKYSENFRCGRDEDWVLLAWKEVIMAGLSAWRTKAGF